MLNRRQLFLGAMAAARAVSIAGSTPRQPWEKAAYRKPAQSRVAILRAQSYDIPLEDILAAGGCNSSVCSLQGKTVVLKPNLVEYDPAGVINTHPAVIAATIAAFKSLGAHQVTVAEGPGHRRDNEYLLTRFQSLPGAQRIQNAVM